MWPKAFAQLIELAPHIGRLVPMADRFFQSKTAGEEANRRAMETMAEGLRGDLGQVSASHAGLYRQLSDQSERLSVMALEVHSVKLGAESTEERLARLETRLGKQSLLFAFVLVLLFVALILLVLVYMHLR